MKILKDAHHSPMFLPLALLGKMRLACTVMVYFDLDQPNAGLPDREMWPQIMPLLPQPPVLDPGLPKPRAEVLIAGKCFAPKGAPRPAAQVNVTVGKLRKTLNVFGDRHWRKTGGTTFAVSDPAPFTVMPITWERAFGGADDPRNPKGLGIAPIRLADGSEAVPLPNIELPGQLVGSLEDRPTPAGMGTREVTHPDRQAKAGTYDATWQKDRWPYYPDDLNPEFFLAAPQDQGFPEYLHGGEAIEITNMHPERQAIFSRVPELRVRLFLTRKAGPKAPPEKDTFEEVKTRIDTLWLFPEILRGVAVFRGMVDTGDDEMADIRYVYMATEALGEAPRDHAYYLEAQTKRLTAMKPVKPVIPDINAMVDRELLKFRRVGKTIAEAKAKAMGQTPVMPREPQEIGVMGQKVIAGGMAVLDKMEAMAIDFRQKFGWRATLDPATFAARRERLAADSARIQATTDKAAASKASVLANQAEMAKSMGASIKAQVPADQLAKAGIDPDNLLPGPKSLGPWHDTGFPFVVACRRNLENDPALMARLQAQGFTTRTLSTAWLGYNPEEIRQDATHWGLAPSDMALPAGLVLPRFTGKTLSAIRIMDDWSGHAGAKGAGDAEEPGGMVPGSDAAPRWLPAPDDPAPVVIVPTGLEALLLEQETGDVCAVAALAKPSTAPGPEAVKTIKTAPIVLVTAPEGSVENLAPATPWLGLSPKAQWLVLPKGDTVLDAKKHGYSLRDTVLDAIPPAVLGLLEAVPPPAYGPTPPRKRPAMPDIAGMLQASMTEIKGFHEAKFDGLKASMKEIEDKARAEMTKHGLDFDTVMAEAAAAPRTPFDEIGKKTAGEILARRDSLKAQGVLSSENEATMTQAAQQAQQLGAESEARWQAGQQQLAAGKEKIAAAKAAQGQMPEGMKAKLKAAGMDPDRMVPRTRDEVIAMHSAGQSLSQAILADVDLSDLNLSGADFTGCRLTGTNFKHSDLTGCIFVKAMAQNADFSGATLANARMEQAMLMKTGFKKADLSGANLYQASLNQADLEGANLAHANLRQASMQKVNIAKAVFSGASLALTVIDKAEASGAVFRDTRFERCMLRSMNLDGADFSGATFESAQLDKCHGKGTHFAGATFHKAAIASCELPGADFTEARADLLHIRQSVLPGAVFRRCNFTRCRIEGSDLTRSDFQTAKTRRSSFPKSNLEGANLRQADLLLSSLAKTRIVETDLEGANCFGVNFHKAVVGKTRFTGANLKMTALNNRTDLLE